MLNLKTNNQIEKEIADYVVISKTFDMAAIQPAKKRVIKELSNLFELYRKLRAAFETDSLKNVSHIQIKLLKKQKKTMFKYAKILYLRLNNWNS